MQDDIKNHIASLEERIVELEQQLTQLQNTDTARFNRIECRQLQLISDTGEPLITMHYDEEETASPFIALHDKTGDILVRLSTDENGGGIALYPTQQTDPTTQVGVEIYIDNNRNGYIEICDTEGEIRAALSVAHPVHGGAGRLSIHGPINNSDRVVIGCNPETDNGSIKTYDVIGKETSSLTHEPCNLRFIGTLPNLRRSQSELKEIDEKLQSETDEVQKHFLNVKKSTISEFISQAEGNDTP